MSPVASLRRSTRPPLVKIIVLYFESRSRICFRIVRKFSLTWVTRRRNILISHFPLQLKHTQQRLAGHAIHQIFERTMIELVEDAEWATRAFRALLAGGTHFHEMQCQFPQLLVRFIAGDGRQ